MWVMINPKVRNPRPHLAKSSMLLKRWTDSFRGTLTDAIRQG